MLCWDTVIGNSALLGFEKLLRGMLLRAWLCAGTLHACYAKWQCAQPRNMFQQALHMYFLQRCTDHTGSCFCSIYLQPRCLVFVTASVCQACVTVKSRDSRGPVSNDASDHLKAM